ncbi:MAG: RluA family pseudouridine synthase [Clostridia bacterium]|nr:RluA family pseudouridine synthase [Clostridia bacterium]
MEQCLFVSNTEGLRIDAWLTGQMDGYSRSYVAQLIKDGLVSVGGKPVKPSLKVEVGMEVQVDLPEPIPDEAEPQDIPLDVLYEDHHLIAINKPKGMVVHPGAGNHDGTLVNALLHHCQGRLSDIRGVVRPGIVHRLDKDTSGVIISAKDNPTHEALSQMFAERQVHKHYLALVCGRTEDSGRIEEPIGRDPRNRLKYGVFPDGRQAITLYTVVERFNKYTLLDVEILTGRTHQIRVHMSHIGHPVAGDPLYGKGDKLFAKAGGQLLHAKHIEFDHPITGEPMAIDSGVPGYMEEALKMLRERGL